MIEIAPPGRRRVVVLAVAAIVLVAGCSSDEGADELPAPGGGSTPVASGDVFSEGSSESSGTPPGGSQDSSSDDDGDFTEVDDAQENSTSGSATTDGGGDGEIEQVPPDEVETIGTPPPTFVYTEEVEPAESAAATLCNLNADFVRSLRSVDASGVPIVDDDLRIGTLSLSDSIAFWRDLAISFPETVDDVDTAADVERLWAEALAADANGDEATALELMAEAEQVLDTLPDAGPADIESCES